MIGGLFINKEEIKVNELLKLLRKYYISDSRQVLVRWIREGKFKGAEKDKRQDGWRVPLESVNEFIDERRPGLREMLADLDQLKKEMNSLKRRIETLEKHNQLTSREQNSKEEGLPRKKQEDYTVDDIKKLIEEVIKDSKSNPRDKEGNDLYTVMVKVYCTEKLLADIKKKYFTCPIVPKDGPRKSLKPALVRAIKEIVSGHYSPSLLQGKSPKDEDKVIWEEESFKEKE
ncbi:helix-turn-helix domain-containing protein [Thalassorhabdus alkalitolerans]|uniref:Helix-turn-helix domain-containing protein n=1 Tax=Thalassorhabdus alkalitolerans TaxID=2282697 RepID=A0ABW0YMH0_9BACI